MYCLLVLPFFLQDLTNSKDLIISRFVTSKPTLMAPNKFIYTWT
jgi:hypothetical protein